MQYTVTSSSKTLKTVHITSSAQVVTDFFTRVAKGNSALHAAKGSCEKIKVVAPAGSKQSEVSESVKNMLVEELLNVAIEREKFIPLHQPAITLGQVVKGQDFSFSASFEVLPDIPLPINLEALTVNVLDPEPEAADLIRVTDYYLKRLSSLDVVEEHRCPRYGDVVDIDVQGMCQGRPVPGMSYNSFRYRLMTAERGALPQEIDAVLFALKKGERGATQIICPAEHPDAEFRGKAVALNIVLNSIFEEKRPIIDDSLATRMGFKGVGDFKLHLYQQARKERMHTLDAEAKAQVLEKLLRPLEFPVPECLVDRYFRSIVRHMSTQLERQALPREAIIDHVQQHKNMALEEARAEARKHSFLLALAYRENIKVKTEEIDTAIKSMAEQSEQSEESLRQHLTHSDEIFEIQDNILTAKALAFLFGKVQKKFVGEDGKVITGKVSRK